MPSAEIRPFSSRRDFGRVLDYFLKADEAFLRGMGVAPARLPPRNEWLERLAAELRKSDAEKKTFYVAWIYKGKRVGHSNINKIRYGAEAYMHLHIWTPELRAAGLGQEFLKLSANEFLRRFRLKRLLCEPWAKNPAPNKALARAGFRFVRRYRTVPGLINFSQSVNRFELTRKIA